MQLNEIFGFGKKDPKANIEKLFRKVAKRIEDQSSYLHLAHTSQGHQDKKDYIRMERDALEKLYQRHQQGDDVTAELNELNKRLKDADGFW